MTFFNLLGIVFFIIILITGAILKKITRKKLKDLEGCGGVNQPGDCKGNLISKG